MSTTQNTTTRADHLAWCKSRAQQLVDVGDLNGALTSMISDLGKHPETQGHPGGTSGLVLVMGGRLSTPQLMREFIDGFN